MFDNRIAQILAQRATQQGPGVVEQAPEGMPPAEPQMRPSMPQILSPEQQMQKQAMLQELMGGGFGKTMPAKQPMGQPPGAMGAIQGMLGGFKKPQGPMGLGAGAAAAGAAKMYDGGFGVQPKHKMQGGMPQGGGQMGKQAPKMQGPAQPKGPFDKQQEQ